MWLTDHWGVPPVALGVAALAVVVYVRGQRRLAKPLSAGQVWLFIAGVVAALLTIASPLGYWSGRDFSARTTEDLLLAYLAAPLLVLGAPWLAFAAGTTRGGEARFCKWLERRRGTKTWSVLSSYAFALGLFLLLFSVWWVPAVIDAGARSSVAHGVEIAASFAATLPLWGQVVGSHPFTPPLDFVGRVGVVVAWFSVTVVAGVAMVFSNSAWYPAFKNVRGAYLPAVADTSVAGGMIWTLPAITLGIVLFWLITAWLKRDSDDDWRLAQLIEETRARMTRPGHA